MTPGRNVKLFTAQVKEGPSALAPIDFIRACQNDSMDKHNMMNFTIIVGRENSCQNMLNVEVAGIFNNNNNQTEYKIFGIIKGASGKVHPLIQEMICGTEYLQEAGLEAMIVIAYSPHYRKGRIYGPLSKMDPSIFLCKTVIGIAIHTEPEIRFIDLSSDEFSCF